MDCCFAQHDIKSFNRHARRQEGSMSYLQRTLIGKRKIFLLKKIAKDILRRVLYSGFDSILAAGKVSSGGRVPWTFDVHSMVGL